MRNKGPLPKELFFSRTSDYLDTFLVKQCNRSEKTRESYRDALTVFMRFVSHTGKSILDFRYADCTYECLLDFKEYLVTELSYRPSSINQRLAAIKSYMRYSYGCDSSLMQIYISVNAVPFSTVPRIQRETIEEELLAKLLDQPPSGRKGLRDTTMMSLLFDAAIRLDELVQLKAGDIYRTEGFTCLLVHGKGNKERKVSLDQQTVKLLDVYLTEYHLDPIDPETPLFYTIIKGEIRSMSHRNIQKILKKYADQMSNEGVPIPNVHPHLLRRSRATNLYQSGTPIEIISRFLGHSSVETTKDHYAYPSMDQLRNAMLAGTDEKTKEATPLWIGHEKELAQICGLR